MTILNLLKKCFMLIVLISSFFLLGCQVTLEQGKELEKLERYSDATSLYWHIIKGDPTIYTASEKKEATDRVKKLKDLGIISEFEQEMSSNKDNLSKQLICELIISYESTPNYNCIALSGINEKNIDDKRFFASSLSQLNSKEISEFIMNQYSDSLKKYYEEIEEKKKKGITANITSEYLKDYYTFVGFYNLPETTDFLLSLLRTEPIDRHSLLETFQLIDNEIIIEPLLAIARNLDLSEQTIISNIFLEFNSPKTYSYLIEFSSKTDNSETENKILAHLEKNITTQNAKYYEKTFLEHSFQPDNNAVITAISLIQLLPPTESTRILTKLLYLKNIPKTETVNAKVLDIVRYINNNMTPANVADLLVALNNNISIHATNDYYAYDELFQLCITITNKYYPNNEYLRSFLLELKNLSSVHRAKESFYYSIQNARSEENLGTIRLMLDSIVSHFETIVKNQPATKLLTTTKYYASKIEDTTIRDLIYSIIENSNYEQTIGDTQLFNVIH
jgi:DNA-binding Lrp family transcriptional regulator